MAPCANTGHDIQGWGVFADDQPVAADQPAANGPQSD